MDRSTELLHDIRDVLAGGLDGPLVAVFVIAFVAYGWWLYRYVKKYR